MHPSWIPKAIDEAQYTLANAIRRRQFSLLALGTAVEWYRFDDRPVAGAFAFRLALETMIDAFGQLQDAYCIFEELTKAIQ